MHRIQRKSSNETLASVGMDSTIDSRMSSAEVPQMELLKVNYVHQCKEALMTKTGSVPNYNFMEFKKTPPNANPYPGRQNGNRQNVARIMVNRHEAPNKPLPPPPPPEVESWQFLQNSKRTTNSPPKFVKQPSPIEDVSDCTSSCCHSSSYDTATESDATLSGDGVKSNSWNYRNKMSTCDVRRDMVRAGIKSRADRIARIEKTECEHSKVTRELGKSTREPARDISSTSREPLRDVGKITREPLRESTKLTKEPARESIRECGKLTRDSGSSSRNLSRDSGNSSRILIRDSGNSSRDLARDSVNSTRNLPKECRERTERNSDSNVTPKEAVAKINQMFEAQKHLKNLPPQPMRPAPVPHKEPNRRLKPLTEKQEPPKLRNSLSNSTQEHPKLRNSLSSSTQEHPKLRNSLSNSTTCTDCSECSECSQECSQSTSSCSDSSCSIISQDPVSFRSNESRERRSITRIPKPIQETHTTRSVITTNLHKTEHETVRERFKRNDKFQTSKSIEHLRDVETSRSPARQRNSMEVDQQLLRNSRNTVANYQKTKMERIHIRKKRQPLLIINQLNESPPPPSSLKAEEDSLKERKSTCGYKNCNFSNCPMSLTDHELNKPYEDDCNKLKRLSLESNSDSGVSSSHDFKEDNKRLTNLKNLDKCSDVKVNDKALQKKSEHFEEYAYDKFKLAKDYDDNNSQDHNHLLSSKTTTGSQIKIQVGKIQTQFSSHHNHYNMADPNDVTNFAKKNLTKATTNEALNNSTSLVKTTTSTNNNTTTTTKQCNIENEQRLKFQNILQRSSPPAKTTTTTHIKIEDDWVKEENSEIPPDDLIECDSLMITDQQQHQHLVDLKKPINSNDNSVKIFVRSSQLSTDLCRSSCISANSFVSQTSICTQNSTNSSTSLSSSSASSVSSSGCGSSSSNADNQSICDSEKECCCQFSNSTGMFFNRPCSALSEEHQQRLCAGSPLSSTDAISDISCVTCSTSPSTVISPLGLSKKSPAPQPPQCCNTQNGVFWNNSYMSLDAPPDDANLPPCCCGISSCDEDNCSYYEGETNHKSLVGGNSSKIGEKIEITHSYTAARVSKFHSSAAESEPQLQLRNPHAAYQPLQKQQIKRSVRNSSAEEILIRNQLLRKTDVIHELRPRSMDGVVDSGVSLNGDSSCGPDSGDHIQNQQDSEARRLKRGHVLSELLETERIYVTEMSSILKGYYDQMHSEEMIHLVPASLQGKEDILFGNLHELYTFHNDIFLKDLENCISTTELVALCFVQRRDTFYRLYSFYCQNIPRSDRLRETLVDTHLFLQECQKRLGHKLPLAAYLLKPVQRITKYQLLLKDLLRFSDSGSCTKELQKALDCMLIVLKCVNDSMHQVAITGFPTDLSQQGELLLQDSFQVWSESKKDIRLRIKPQQRHIFLYQKSMLFCKQTSKPGHNKSTYQFKNYLKMSQIGLTESVRGDTKRFEVWLQGRQEVHTIQAPTLDIKNKWVAEIKRVLLNQLEELKGEKIKQYGLNHRGLRQTTSWDTPNIITSQRTISCDASSESSNRNSNCSSSDDNCAISVGMMPISSNVSMTSATSSAEKEHNNEACGWSSDYSNSEDEMSVIEDNSTPGSKFVALADYVAVGHSEVSMREGDNIELLKVGCAGWWYVRILDTNSEGWTPAAYLESINRKSSRSSSRNQERLNLHKLQD